MKLFYTFIMLVVLSTGALAAKVPTITDVEFAEMTRKDRLSFVKENSKFYMTMADLSITRFSKVDPDVDKADSATAAPGAFCHQVEEVLEKDDRFSEIPDPKVSIPESIKEPVVVVDHQVKNQIDQNRADVNSLKGELNALGKSVANLTASVNRLADQREEADVANAVTEDVKIDQPEETLQTDVVCVAPTKVGCEKPTMSLVAYRIIPGDELVHPKRMSSGQHQVSFSENDSDLSGTPPDSN